MIAGRGSEAGPSRRTGTTGEPRKPKKKKAKEVPRPQSSGPIPAPYLAIAPSPVSSLSRNALNDLVLPTANHLVLPSTFVRARSSPNVRDAPVPAPSPPATRRGYAANLAAPPLIMPGGTSATPRIQDLTNPPARRRGEGRRRSEEGLRAVAQANQSMASLGVLGRIMESDPVTGGGEAAPVQRRRRRVIREDVRMSQPPVSTAEEGRAIGLARGASMRRLSVWDGLPDAGEAPPPFIVPQSTTPAPAVQPISPTLPIDHDPPPPFEARGRSPPPTWEQAVSQTDPVPAIPSPSPAIAPTNEAPISAPTLAVETPSRAASIRSTASTATHYASAHESPASSSEEEGTEEEREDRRMWNADISAGYSLGQRVEREAARKTGREAKNARDAREQLDGASAQETEVVEEGGPPPISETTSLVPPEDNRTPAGEAESMMLAPVTSDAVGPAVENTPTEVMGTSSSPTPVLLDQILQPPQSSAPETSAATPSSSAEPVTEVPEFFADPATPPIDIAPHPPIPTPAAPIENGVSEGPASLPSYLTHAQRPASIEPSDPPPAISIPDARSSDVPVRKASTSTAKSKGSTRTRKRSTKVKAQAATPAAQSIAQVTTNAQSSSAVSPPVQAAARTSPVLLSPAQQSQADAYRALTGTSDPSTSPGLLSPAQQSQAETYRTLTGTSDPSLPQSPPTVPSAPVVPSSSDQTVSVKPVLADESTHQSTSAARPLHADSPKFTTHALAPPKEPSPTGSDVVLAPMPQRKLTRGKAIRRSSSGLTVLSDATAMSSMLESGPESPRSPLFGDTQFNWRPAERQKEDETTVSARPRPLHQRSASSIAILRSPPQQAEVFRQNGRALGSFDTAFDTIASTTSPVASPVSEALPPHREAALKRRELVTRSPEIPAIASISSPRVSALVPAPAPPPLIDISASTPPRQATYRSPPPLISRELYQLFDEDEPVAESSSQAVARMEQEQIFKAIKRDRREWAVDEIQVEEGDEQERAPTPPSKSPRRAPPPPPPLRRNLISTTVGANLTPRRSIIRSADTPVTPRPIRQLSVGSQDRPSILPTRRPAPPPPPSKIESDPDERTPIDAPPLPPRPAPLYRPLTERRGSAFSQADTASSLSDRTIPLTNFASASPRRPKGPRPPPPPPRWARIIMPLHDVKAPLRPTSERTQSDSVSLSMAGDGVKIPTRRSTSEHDLRSSSAGSPLEYTDLDVLVSRLEGSGREYEGFSQITAFLGPGKSLAAKPEALATLLPGLISVDSRRVTSQGKVKLKLSLLGVRVTKCPICLGQFKKDESGVLLPECGHVSHEDCATRWFREDWRCFVCRVPLIRDESGGVGMEVGGSGGGRMGEGIV